MGFGNGKEKSFRVLAMCMHACAFGLLQFEKVQFVANRMAPKWPRSDGYFDSYAHSTEVLSKRPFLVDFLEYGS